MGSAPHRAPWGDSLSERLAGHSRLLKSAVEVITGVVADVLFTQSHEALHTFCDLVARTLVFDEPTSP